jgi:hypothetical protein
MSEINRAMKTGENGSAVPRRAAASFNKPDAVNPAMALRLAIEDQWRRVTDLERWAEPHIIYL